LYGCVPKTQTPEPGSGPDLMPKIRILIKSEFLDNIN
jgi:hypothetical protein